MIFHVVMMSVFVKMNKTMEILNLIVGFELIFIGLLFLSISDYSSAASWSIFGCMYIVMDKYTDFTNMSNNRSIVQNIKYAGAWIGFIISTIYLIYVLMTV